MPEAPPRSIVRTTAIKDWTWEAIDAAVDLQPGVEGSAGRRSGWRVAKRVLSTCPVVVLAVVALLTTFVAVSTRLSSGQLGVLGHPVMVVLSGSMAPVINAGDLVVAKHLTPAQAASLREGQVITFRAVGGTRPVFTHRITAVETLPDGRVAYRTKGDANDSEDRLAIPSTEIVGLYQWKIPYGGYALNALHRPLVLGVLLASPFLWLLFGWLWKWAGRTDEPSAEGAQSS